MSRMPLVCFTWALSFLVLSFLGCSSSEDEALAPSSIESLDAATEGGGAVPRPGGGVDGTIEVEGGEAVQADVLEPIPACLDDTECAATETCDCAGACVAAGSLVCEEDKNCGSGAYCDGCSAMCYPLKELCAPCAADNECDGTGSRCLGLASGGTVCATQCLSQQGCPDEFICTDLPTTGTSYCVPESGDCGMSLVECTEDNECAFPLVCGGTGLCVEGCADDVACGDGKVCEAGKCVPACGVDGVTCDSAKICVEGHCTVEGGCIDSTDCPEPETYCDLELSLCVPGCQLDFDCKSSAQMCLEGSCVKKGCTGNYFCAFGEVCDVQSGDCVVPPEPHCGSCDSGNDTTCASLSETNQCLSFQDESGAVLGDFCLVGCGPDPANPCPQGYNCQDLELDENGTTKALCVRDCSVPPI